MWTPPSPESDDPDEREKQIKAGHPYQRFLLWVGSITIALLIIGIIAWSQS